MTVDEGTTDGALVVAKGTFIARVPSGDTMHAEVPLVERKVNGREERKLKRPEERYPRFLH